MRPERTASSVTCCLGSIPQAARFTRSSSRAPKIWRTTFSGARPAACRLPARGRIGIFNRSYYEEVVVVRVHPELLEAQRLPRRKHGDRSFWKDRYRSINDFEKHLHRNGTQVVKIFLHLSRETQRQRFLARLDHPAKRWKFSLADVHERGLWSDYKSAYEKCLEATSTDHAPWYAVPADDKDNARLIVSQIALDTLGALKMAYPQGDASKQEELAAARAALEQPGKGDQGG